MGLILAILVISLQNLVFPYPWRHYIKFGFLKRTIYQLLYRSLSRIVSVDVCSEGVCFIAETCPSPVFQNVWGLATLTKLNTEMPIWHTKFGTVAHLVEPLGWHLCWWMICSPPRISLGRVVGGSSSMEVGTEPPFTALEIQRYTFSS